MNDRKEEKNPQMKPDGGHISTERFQSMSPSQLAEEMEQVLGAMTEETYDPALIDAYLDALDEKAPMPPVPDPAESFERLKKKLAAMPLEEKQETPAAPGAEREVKEDKPAPRRGWSAFRRMVTSVAAAACLLFVFMVGAQAAGIDVFGNLARWTDEQFSFIIPEKTEPKSEYYEPFRQALEKQELPQELAPTWYPEGFRAGEPELWDDKISKTVQLSFSNEEEDRSFAIYVDLYTDPKFASWPFEKDDKAVELYTSNGRAFYIFTNLKSRVALWGEDLLQFSIIGDLSVEEIKGIIDSMGGS